MKQLLIILLLGIPFVAVGQKNAQPQFIELMAKFEHPERLLADYRPLYISTVELNLPLPAPYAKIIEHKRKLKPAMSAIEINRMKEFYLTSTYSKLIIDSKLYDVIHDYILRNRNLLTDKLHRPACLVVIDNKNYYLSQNKMKPFYSGLKVELLSKKCDTWILGKIKEQFTINPE
jgi:hypothetical protein